MKIIRTLTSGLAAFAVCLLTIGLLAGFGTPTHAQTLFGAAHQGPDGLSTLYSIDETTGVATPIGTGIGFERVTVPGALEIPLALSAAVTSKLIGPSCRHQGCVALGCVIRGETSHYDIVAQESARALIGIGVTHSIALGNGILTVDNREQAWVRASVDSKNKGRDAAAACASLMELSSKFERKKSQ